MKKIAKFTSIFLILSLLAPISLFAADIDALRLNIPNIQNIDVSEQTGPQKSLDMVLEAPIDAKSYIVGPGDVLAVHIMVGTDLTIDHNLLVGADGNVYFPNIGAIYLSGLNLDQAKQKIDAKIKNIYFEPFKLYVLLTQPKKVKIYLSGMVKTPGPIVVNDNSRISEVLSLSGGPASGASNRYVYIKRQDGKGNEKVIKADIFEAYRSRDLSKDIRIRAGDVVEVPDANNERISQLKDSGHDQLLFEGKESFVYIYGEVVKSGRFEYIPGKKLSDYISYAGGPTGKALLRLTTITRQVNGKSEQIKVNAYDSIYNSDAKNDIEILGGDVVNIPGNFFYVPDFTSFANMVLLGFTLYATVVRR